MEIWKLLFYLWVSITKIKTMELTINLSAEQFNRDLETCLTIISYPDKKNPYYVCEYISPALYKSIVHILITKQ